MDRDAYEADTKTQRAVERNLQIVGDAAHKLSNALKQANADIPWDGIYAARNAVVHVYFGVNQRSSGTFCRRTSIPSSRR